jgi:hypothetical protein
MKLKFLAFFATKYLGIFMPGWVTIGKEMHYLEFQKRID